MGVLFDYFAAASDELAAGVIDVTGGPPAAREPSFATVALKGVDPAVQLGTLESLLTGLPYDVISAGPRQAHALAVRDKGERLVLTVTDELQAALAEADDGRLREVAVPWSQTEEFWGNGDPGELAGILMELASLARDGRARGERLYCWVCV